MDERFFFLSLLKVWKGWSSFVMRNVALFSETSLSPMLPRLLLLLAW